MCVVVEFNLAFESGAIQIPERPLSFFIARAGYKKNTATPLALQH
jgi:hypothetical protein